VGTFIVTYWVETTEWFSQNWVWGNSQNKQSHTFALH